MVMVVILEIGFVQDHVDALLLCALKGIPGETYCIGGYGEQTNKYIVNRICEIMDNENIK